VAPKKTKPKAKKQSSGLKLTNTPEEESPDPWGEDNKNDFEPLDDEPKPKKTTKKVHTVDVLVLIRSGCEKEEDN
jgi:hypothetical protein